LSDWRCELTTSDWKVWDRLDDQANAVTARMLLGVGDEVQG
jgi:hypothetical protein